MTTTARRWLAGLSVACGLAVWCAPQAARATFPSSSCSSTEVVVMPMNGNRDVPTDARIMMWTVSPSLVNELGDYLLVHDTYDLDEIVDFSVEAQTFGEWQLLLLHPEPELEPDADYTLIPPVDGGGDWISFDTGEGPATSPPDEVWIREVWTGSGCDACGMPLGSTVVTIEIADADRTGVLYQVEVGADEEFGTSTVVWSYDRVVDLGYTPCSTLDGEFGHGDEVWIRVRSVDLAGNASAWSTAIPTVLGYETDPRMCTVCGSGILLLGLGFRRLRR